MIKPHLMWGSTSVVTVGQTSGSTFVPTRVSAQLANVSYHKPETWAFYFTGRLLGGRADPGAAIVVLALFDLVLGLGRAGHETGNKSLAPTGPFESFCRFKWTLPLGQEPGTNDNNNKYTTLVPAPRQDDDVVENPSQLIDHVVAQEIQCTCRVTQIVGAATTNAIVEVGAFFAPFGSGGRA